MALDDHDTADANAPRKGVENPVRGRAQPPNGAQLAGWPMGRTFRALLDDKAAVRADCD